MDRVRDPPQGLGDGEHPGADGLFLPCHGDLGGEDGEFLFGAGHGFYGAVEGGDELGLAVDGFFVAFFHELGGSQHVSTDFHSSKGFALERWRIGGVGVVLDGGGREQGYVHRGAASWLSVVALVSSGSGAPDLSHASRKDCQRRFREP